MRIWHVLIITFLITFNVYADEFCYTPDCSNDPPINGGSCLEPNTCIIGDEWIEFNEVNDPDLSHYALYCNGNWVINIPSSGGDTVTYFVSNFLSDIYCGTEGPYPYEITVKAVDNEGLTSQNHSNKVYFYPWSCFKKGCLEECFLGGPIHYPEIEYCP